MAYFTIMLHHQTLIVEFCPFLLHVRLQFLYSLRSLLSYFIMHHAVSVESGSGLQAGCKGAQTVAYCPAGRSGDVPENAAAWMAKPAFYCSALMVPSPVPLAGTHPIPEAGVDGPFSSLARRTRRPRPRGPGCLNLHL